MDHFAPHKSASFEGYYSKFRLPSGGSIALIISAVPAAAQAIASASGNHHRPELLLSRWTSLGNSKPNPKPSRPYMVSFTYVSANSEVWWQREYWPESMDTKITETRSPGVHGFEITWKGGEFIWIPACEAGETDTVKWVVKEDDLEFRASTISDSSGSGSSSSLENRNRSNGRLPWDPQDPKSTPAGFMANLPLPIQWHVHTLDSCAAFSFTSPLSTDQGGPDIHPKDEEGNSARVHIEKNWANSFPEEYIWIQARDHTSQRGLCLAGGSLIPGVQAFLVGYHGDKTNTLGKNQKRWISFKPPTSTSLPGLSLGLLSDISYFQRTAMVDIKGYFTRLKIEAIAPENTFFTFSAPLAYGHQPDFSVQSFGATVDVTIYERGWRDMITAWIGGGGGWKVAERERFERGSLEFGGGYYKPHGE